MALIQKHQCIGRQIVHQRGRRVTRRGARQVARVVFNALAVTHLLQHLQVKPRTLFEPLGFDQFAAFDQKVQALAQLDLDGVNGGHNTVTRGHVVAGRVNREPRNFLQHAARQWVEQLQAFNFVVKEFDAQRQLGVLGRKDIDGVAAHPKRTARKVDFIARVLHANELRDHVALTKFVAYPQGHHHAVVIGGVTDAVDGADAGHDDHVPALQQTLGGAQAHLLDVLVDGAVFFDEQVALGHIGFRLVVVVVADEILHGVLRKKIAELAIQLRSQGFVGRKNDRRPPQARDHAGHGERLARTRHAQQGLEAQSIADAFDQFLNGRRLISSRCKGLQKLEWRVGKGHEFTFTNV